SSEEGFTLLTALTKRCSMDMSRLTRREMLATTVLGGVLLGTGAQGRAAKEDGPKYPSEKVLGQLRKEGWVGQDKPADVKREGVGLRAPSILPPDKYVAEFRVVEAQCKARKLNVLMPNFAHVGNQTCLATRVEAEANGKPLKQGTDYTVKAVVTR